eukprot:gene18681-21259_t
MFTVLSFFLALVASAIAYHGVDVSQSTSSSSFSCMKGDGYSFAIVRVYQSNGVVDANGPTTINNAWAGGMSYVDGYIFPCYSCGNPAKQMDDTVNNLANHNTKYGMLWLDVEGTQYWSSSASNNVNFLQGMVDEGKKRGISLGIYSSASQWNPIMGGSTQFSSLPLWYPHYDNNPSFSDFSSFGGWSKPSIKQYIGTTSFCSASVDKNYY